MFITVLFAKLLLCFFTFMPLAFSAEQGESPDYFTALLEGEDVKVDCSNILDFMHAYFDLSEKSHSLLGVSFNRFMSEVTSYEEKTAEEKEKMNTDISRASFAMQENQFVLSDKVMIIMEVLPDCLKSSE